MRIIGLDIHRAVAEAVVLEDGTARRLGRVDMTRESLQAFAARLLPTDHVVVEATGNAAAVVDILAPKVARVVVANPLQVHLIAPDITKNGKDQDGQDRRPRLGAALCRDTGPRSAGHAAQPAG